jgi:hypothetical protein
VRRWLLIAALSAAAFGVQSLLATAFHETTRVLRAPESELHEVGGVTMMAEQPCTLQLRYCARWGAAALTALALPASTKVSRVSWADTGYV